MTRSTRGKRRRAHVPAATRRLVCEFCECRQMLSADLFVNLVPPEFGTATDLGVQLLHVTPFGKHQIGIPSIVLPQVTETKVLPPPTVSAGVTSDQLSTGTPVAALPAVVVAPGDGKTLLAEKSGTSASLLTINVANNFPRRPSGDKSMVGQPVGRGLAYLDVPSGRSNLANGVLTSNTEGLDSSTGQFLHWLDGWGTGTANLIRSDDFNVDSGFTPTITRMPVPVPTSPPTSSPVVVPSQPDGLPANPGLGVEDARIDLANDTITEPITIDVSLNHPVTSTIALFAKLDQSPGADEFVVVDSQALEARFNETISHVSVAAKSYPFHLAGYTEPRQVDGHVSEIGIAATRLVEPFAPDARPARTVTSNDEDTPTTEWLEAMRHDSDQPRSDDPHWQPVSTPAAVEAATSPTAEAREAHQKRRRGRQLESATVTDVAIASLCCGMLVMKERFADARDRGPRQLVGGWR